MSGRLLEALPMAAANELSIGHVKGVVAASQELFASLPEYVGMTLYGLRYAVVRTPKVNVDAFAFVEVSQSGAARQEAREGRARLIRQLFRCGGRFCR
jgi:hypothetical protein